MSRDEVLAIRLGEGDDVAVVLSDVAAGQTVRVAGRGRPLTLAAREPVPTHHKIALVSLGEGVDVIRNGTVIGRACKAIEVGECVHVHNLVSRRGRSGGRD